MKKLMALVLFVSATLSFTACSSDDNAPIRSEINAEGTWYADKLSYTYGTTQMIHNYTEMPGENAVYQTDKLVIIDNKATLTEYFKNNPKPVVTVGTVKNNTITFDKEGYAPRQINSIVNGQLSLTYNYTMRGATLPVTVTYSNSNPAQYIGTWSSDKLSYTLGSTQMTHNYTEMPGENAVSKPDNLVLTENTAVLTEYFKNKKEPVITNGTIKGNIITFEKENYTPRKINGIVKGQLSLTYDYTMRGSTLPVTVTYTSNK
ncbi:hypothetical protein [Myroides odoratimimus]|uniref:hypothetical protein n=1 Tax=Myroides odoratimimus TaxID=76832 RepID=UPI001CE17B07|nr:hypothetical protein [Myroides odoratimimus]MCA4805460.1 hypothetical protein [Myroides odoratimimus]